MHPKVREHRGWEYWLDAGTQRYIGAKFDGTETAQDSVEADSTEELLEKINAAEDATMVFADTEQVSSVCHACFGEGDSLGALGARAYYRCRQCGMTYY